MKKILSLLLLLVSLTTGLAYNDVVTYSSGGSLNTSYSGYAVAGSFGNNNYCLVLGGALPGEMVFDVLNTSSRTIYIVGTGWSGYSTSTFSTSDFSAGVDSWAATTGTSVTGNVDNIVSTNDCLRISVDTTTGNHYATTKNLLPGSGSAHLKVSFSYYIPSGTVVAKIKVDAAAVIGGDTKVVSTTGSWQRVTDWDVYNLNVLGGTTPLRFWLGDSTSYSFTGDGIGVAYVKDVIVKQVDEPSIASGSDLKLFYNGSAWKYVNSSGTVLP